MCHGLIVSGGVEFTLGAACFVSDRYGGRQLSERAGCGELLDAIGIKGKGGKFITIFFIIVLLVVIVLAASSSAKKSQLKAVQEVKTQKSAFLDGCCRTVEALDILDHILKKYDKGSVFGRFIYPVATSYGEHHFHIECTIRDEDNDLRNCLDSIKQEESRRSSIKWYEKLEREGHPEPLSPEIKSLHELYTVWHELTDEQVHTLYKEMESFDKNFEENERIKVQRSLPLTVYNDNDYSLNSYLRALGDIIHAKFPNYDIQVTSAGIIFNPGNGSIEYKNV